MIDQLPLAELTTPAGIVVAGALVRQTVEVLKGSLIPWLDGGNERKGVVLVTILLYIVWLAAYGQSLAIDGWTAFASTLAVSAAAIGTNEGIDAARNQVAKNVVNALKERPALAEAAADATGVTAVVAAVAAAPAAVAATAPAAGVDEDEVPDDDEVPDEEELSVELEPGPDVDLLVAEGEVIDLDEDDEEAEDDVFDPAAPKPPAG